MSTQNSDCVCGSDEYSILNIVNDQDFKNVIVTDHKLGNEGFYYVVKSFGTECSNQYYLCTNHGTTYSSIAFATIKHGTIPKFLLLRDPRNPIQSFLDLVKHVKSIIPRFKTTQPVPNTTASTSLLYSTFIIGQPTQNSDMSIKKSPLLKQTFLIQRMYPYTVAGAKNYLIEDIMNSVLKSKTNNNTECAKVSKHFVAFIDDECFHAEHDTLKVIFLRAPTTPIDVMSTVDTWTQNVRTIQEDIFDGHYTVTDSATQLDTLIDKDTTIDEYMKTRIAAGLKPLKFDDVHGGGDGDRLSYSGRFDAMMCRVQNVTEDEILDLMHKKFLNDPKYMYRFLTKARASSNEFDVYYIGAKKDVTKKETCVYRLLLTKGNNQNHCMFTYQVTKKYRVIVSTITATDDENENGDYDYDYGDNNENEYADKGATSKVLKRSRPYRFQNETPTTPLTSEVLPNRAVLQAGPYQEMKHSELKEAWQSFFNHQGK